MNARTLCLLGLIGVRSGVATTVPDPDFVHGVAPIIYSQCAACHRPHGGAPFSLLTFEEVKRHAHQIAAVTQSRYMPPWQPEPGYGEFRDERRLTEEQIRTIADWVNAGCPQGPAQEALAPPEFPSGWELGPPDLVLEVSKPLSVRASGTDVFWNFILKPDLKYTRYIRAIEIRPSGSIPGNRNSSQLVHHANLLIDRTGSTLKNEQTPGDGFPGMDLNINHNPFDPDSHFLFWKPGSEPYSEAEGFSWRLDPGNVLVLNTHIQPSGKSEQVAPAVALYFTEQPPTQYPLLLQLEADDQLDIPPGTRDFRVADDFTLPVSATVLAIYPHAHYLGTLLEAYAMLPDGTRHWLIRMKHWDLNWQSVYRYREPVRLPKGTVISMRYHYDNSAENVRNPNHPPKRVVAGNEARDEMAHLWLQVLPDGEGDRRRPIQEALLRHRLQKNPGDYAANLNMGALLMARLDPQGAIPLLANAIRLNPSRSEAHDMLGSALTNVGRFADALRQFRLAVTSQPDDMQAHYNVANALVRARQWKEASTEMKLVASAYPQSARIQAEFGLLLYKTGDGEAASAQFHKALALDATNKQAADGLQLISRTPEQGK